MRPPLAAALLAALLAVPAAAAPPEPEKCTCDLQRNAVEDDGAKVLNATACWSTELHDRQWCDISVASLRGSGGHRRTVAIVLNHAAAGDGAGLARDLAEAFAAYLGSADPTAPSRWDLDPERAQTEAAAVLTGATEALGRCATGFAQWHEAREGAVSGETDRLRCSVGSDSGWLRIEVMLEGGRLSVVYMIAPDV